jgi:hypothetical protein
MNIIVDYVTAKKLNSFWYKSYLSNNMRTFIYKFHNNTLPYNTVLSHFVRDVSRNCTFCDISLIVEEEDETPLHLFYGCPVTEQILMEFYSILLDENNFTPTRNDIFIGFDTGSERKNKILNVINYITLHFIWECKLRKTLPYLYRLCKYTISEIAMIKHHNKSFSLWCNSSNVVTNLEAALNNRF